MKQKCSKYICHWEDEVTRIKSYNLTTGPELQSVNLKNGFAITEEILLLKQNNTLIPN